jgi:PhnB protein
MRMTLNPYLAFDGRCRAAFEFYARALGGRITYIQTYGESPMGSNVPAGHHDRVMHVTMHVGDQVLQGADAPPGPSPKPSGFCVALHYDEPAEGERVFQALAENGTIQMPFQPTFWAKGFGMLIDQFGTPWLVNAGQLVEAAK